MAVAVLAPNREAVSRFYRPELDALRFFAFIGVFACHFLKYSTSSLINHGVPAKLVWLIAAFPSAGAYGVDLFFALSAYLITELLLREKRTFGTLDVKSFYIRRILRIWPLYFAFVAISFIPWFHSWEHYPLYYPLAFVFLQGNWAVVYFGDTLLTIISPLWTISIEEQFYLFWPPIVKRLSRNGIIQAAIQMIVWSGVIRFVMVSQNYPASSIYCNTFTHLEPIAAGILIAAILNGRELKLSLSVRCYFLVAGILGFLYVTTTGINVQAVQQTILPNIIGYPICAASAGLILLSAIGIPWKIPNVLTYLGKISYGLYVLHYLGMFLAVVFLKNMPRGGVHAVLQIALGFVNTVVLAALSYRFLEGPFLRLKNRFAKVQSRPV